MKQRQQAAHMQVAHIYGELSYCNRLKVGCIVVQPSPEGDRVISIGYNGTPPGEDNVCELPDNTTKPSVIHAEHNAIRKLTQGEAEGAYVFCTHTPCDRCADLMIEAKIDTLFYRHQYRDLAPIERMINQGITVKQI